MGILKNKRGFTIAELAFTMAIIAIISGVTFNEVRHIIEKQKTEEAADAIRKIYAGSIDYYNTNSHSYADVTMTVLCANGYINNDICDENGLRNVPWGGDYIVSSPAATEIQIQATNIPTRRCRGIVEVLEIDLTLKSAVCSDNTITVIYYSNAV